MFQTRTARKLIVGVALEHISGWRYVTGENSCDGWCDKAMVGKGCAWGVF